MRIVLIVLSMLLSVPLASGTPVGAEEAGPGQKPVPELTKPEKYRQQAEKRMKYIACVKMGKAECYKRYQDAIDWCEKNWKLCYPLIDGLGMRSTNYGDQVFRKCQRELEDRCRREVEP